MWSRTWRVASAGRIWRTTTRCTGKVLFSYLDKHFKACKIFIKIEVDCARSHKNYSPFHLLSSRFPSTSPLKPIPCPAPASAPGSIKKRPSFRDKEGFFKFRSFKKQERETQVSWIGHKVFYLYCVSIELILKVRDIYWRKYFPNQSNGNMSTKNKTQCVVVVHALFMTSRKMKILPSKQRERISQSESNRGSGEWWPWRMNRRSGEISPWPSMNTHIDLKNLLPFCVRHLQHGLLYYD